MSWLRVDGRPLVKAEAEVGCDEIDSTSNCNS